MRNTILIIISLLAAIYLHAQNPNFEWVKSNQGYQGDANSYYIQTDSLSNIYSIGLFSGTIDFNPSPSNATWLTSISSGFSFYIQKLDSNGNLIWVRQIDFSYGYVKQFSVSQAGRIYIVGIFQDSVDIDPGSTTQMLYSNGEIDVLILKLSANGNFIWAKSFGGPEDDFASDIVADSQGNVYTHGSYKDTVDFDPGVGTCIYGAGWTPHPGNYALSNAFIQKLDINGNFVWVKAFLNNESAGGSNGKCIDLDSNGNVYCTGSFSASACGGIDFNPGQGVSTPPSNASGMYIVKLDSSGGFDWSKFTTYIGSWGAASVNSIHIDRFNHIYTTGDGGFIDLDPGPDTLFLAAGTFIQKFDENGNLIWGVPYGGPGYHAEALSLTTDTLGNIYSTGYFADSTDLDPGPDTLVFYAQGAGSSGHGAYFQKLNSTGNLLMAGIIQANAGVSNWSRGWDITINTKGDIFATGDYGGSVDFDISSGAYNQASINNRAATYILKLSQCKTLTTDHITTCDSLIWMDGITYYNSTQSAYFTLSSATGCDSVIVLNLNIPVIDTTISVSTNGIFSSNQNATFYQWLDCNSGLTALLGDTLQSFTPTVNGNYAVAIDVSGCMDTSACVNINNVSIEELTENTIKLYPNPNTGKFTLNLGNLRSAEIKILNSMGQELLFVQGKNSNYFDLELKPGVYFIQIRDNEVVKTLRFVVN